ncbi:metallophosphoesterase [uncultured Amnibacterium sp.]|uniref:metallophosphoesterase n=1 Tax=uncultured Amnibacterium sp. TaxID=1631851 RepID=UPI0035CA2E52
MPVESAPTHVIGHVTDSHFTASGELHGAVRPADTFGAALAALEATGIPLDALVHTGDVADAGDEHAYEQARASAAVVLERTGWPMAWAAGNHDLRGPMRQHLLGTEPSDAPLDSVVDLGGLRLIVLDTSIPQRVEGGLDAEQLQWLDTQLHDLPEHGAVLAMHHAPVPVQVTALQALHLTGQAPLADLLRGRGVRAVLGGHLHYATASLFAGVPVFVAPATAYSIRIGAPGSGVTGTDGPRAVGLLSLYADGAIGYTPVPSDPVRVVAETPEQAFAAMGVLAPR